MKTDYASLRSQVRNFSEFYGAAINDAKKQVRTSRQNQPHARVCHPDAMVSPSHLLLLGQISAAIVEMSEANKDLLEKYRKEVALRRKYHEQLVELKGERGGNPAVRAGSPFRLGNFVLSPRRQHPRAVSREARAEGGPARGGPVGGGDHGPQQ